MQMLQRFPTQIYNHKFLLNIFTITSWYLYQIEHKIIQQYPKDNHTNFNSYFIYSSYQ